MDVPSRQAVAVQLGPARGAKPTVYLSDYARVLDPSMRQGLSEALERLLAGRAVMIEPRQSFKLKHAFAAYEFAAGTLPHEAIQLVQMAKAWFFQGLASARDRRNERRLRKAQNKAMRMENRRERHQIRRNFRPFRGASVHFG